MGMDAQTVGSLQQGVDLISDLVNMTGDSGDDTPYAAEAEARARLTEQDARESARNRQRDARQAAADHRDTAEHDRSYKHADWGKSNLAMSGSKQLIDRSDRLKDRQEEDDILFSGDQDARSTLNRGRRQSNMLRINNDVSRDGTTLSMGSKLYRYGG